MQHAIAKVVTPLIERGITQNIYPSAQFGVWVGEQMQLLQCYGYIDPDTQTQPINEHTMFDLASVSKLFTAIAFMQLVEAGLVSIEQPVCDILPEFSHLRPILDYPDLRSVITPPLHASDQHANASRVTFQMLMAHNSGLPPGLPLHMWEREWRERHTDETWWAHRHLPNEFHAERLAFIKPRIFNTAFAYPTCSRVWYSDVGYILLGFAIERITGLALRRVIQQNIIMRLGLKHTDYGPISHTNVPPTEFYERWGRRMWGEVHDGNALALGGAAGHAGLFASAHDLLVFGRVLLNGGAPLINPATLGLMRQPFAQNTPTQAAQLPDGIAMVRGLGFQLWSEGAYSPTAPFSPQVFGHTGFTGTSVFVDPTHDMVVVFLTNRLYAGRHTYIAMRDLRNEVHRGVIHCVSASAQ